VLRKFGIEDAVDRFIATEFGNRCFGNLLALEAQWNRITVVATNKKAKSL
jgi:hypothetical protein